MYQIRPSVQCRAPHEFSSPRRHVKALLDRRMYGMLQGLPLLSTAEQLDEVRSFLSAGGPAADVPPLIKAR